MVAVDHDTLRFNYGDHAVEPCREPRHSARWRLRAARPPRAPEPELATTENRHRKEKR
jgi:hypothetical protein